MRTGPLPNMALQRTRRPRFRSDRSLRSLGSPLNARPLCVGKFRAAWSPRQHGSRPAVSVSAPACPPERLSHHRGVRTGFEELLARQGLDANEIAAA
jgi:hypothetical protein